MKAKYRVLYCLLSILVAHSSLVGAEDHQVQLSTALAAINLNGYVEASAIWQPGTGKSNVGRSFDRGDKTDGINLHVASLTLAKPVVADELSAGFTLNFLTGPDAVGYNTSAGAGDSDFSIKQAYVELGFPVGNGLSVKVGSFDTIVGYEYIDNYLNPNFSRSYGYLVEPFSHTGLIAIYKATEWLGISLGIADTYDSGVNLRPTRGTSAAAESEKTYLGLITLSAPENWKALEGASLNFGFVDGLTSLSDAADSTLFWTSLQFPLPLEGLACGLSYEYFGTRDSPSLAARHAQAMALYLTYQATGKLKFANRLEYAKGSNGVWTFDGPWADTGPANNRGDLFLAETFTVDYALFENVVTRVEFRYDRDLTARGRVNAAFGNDQRNNVAFALNVIFRF